VTSYPGADAKRREAEATEAFELLRPASEQWGFREATVAAIPTLDHRGLYDLYWFQRQADGNWTHKVVVEWCMDSERLVRSAAVAKRLNQGVTPVAATVRRMGSRSNIAERQ
jgi:hypothetical protein